jgi:hypothetical protein
MSERSSGRRKYVDEWHEYCAEFFAMSGWINAHSVVTMIVIVVVAVVLVVVAVWTILR